MADPPVSRGPRTRRRTNPLLPQTTGRRRWYGWIAAVGLIVAALAFVIPKSMTRGSAAAGRGDDAHTDNPVVAENGLPGTGQWRIVKVADDQNRQIKGYASAASVDLGQTIDFFVTVKPTQAYSIDIYRIGYYQGTGGRLMQHVPGLPGTTQALCPTDEATGMISCKWSPGYSLSVPTTWTSGVFLAKLTNAEGFQNYITFTVRDDARKSDLLYQQSVSTYQAYNNYPDDKHADAGVPTTGKSLYDFNSSNTPTTLGTRRAVKVSYDRPYSDAGAGDFLKYEDYFIRWVEQNGYDVTYSTDVDTDLNGSRLRDHRGFLSVGHDEYWSKAMFDAAAAARDHGVSLGFFGGNDTYWQVRFEPSGTGQADRVQVCYKDPVLDPIKDTTTTALWRDRSVRRAEQQLMGAMFVAAQPNSTDPPAPYVVTNSSNWVYAKTGLHDGDTVPGIVGYEVDQHQSDAPEPRAVQGTYVELSHSPFSIANGPVTYQESTVYQAPSGAWVFDAGSIKWSWGLYNDGQRFADERIEQMTENVLDRFAAGSEPPAGAGN